ncbi:hypothetical protein LDENG_00160420, partial [Lucifuga dentata]
MAACFSSAAVRCSVKFLLKDSLLNVNKICCLSSANTIRGYAHSTGRSSASSSSSDSSAPGRTVGQYEQLVQQGSLRDDAQQRHVLQQLVQLQHVLKNYCNSIYMKRVEAKDDNTLLQKDENPQNKGGNSPEKEESPPPPPPPKGFYIYGAVGKITYRNML